MEHLYMIGLMLVGFVIHALAKTYEEDKKVPERRITPVNVYWDGPERWRTAATLMFIVVGGALLPVQIFTAIANVQYNGVQFGWFVLVVVGYNIDSISQKILSLGRKKPEA